MSKIDENSMIDLGGILEELDNTNTLLNVIIEKAEEISTNNSPFMKEIRQLMTIARNQVFEQKNRLKAVLDEADEQA